MEAVARLNEDFATRTAASPELLGTGAGVDLRAWLADRLSAGPAPPSLNKFSTADPLADGQLVHFCGMVQDVRDPEFYDGAYEIVGADGTRRLRTTKYQGAIAQRPGETLQSRADAVWQRMPVVCVPIPSRTGWLQERLAADDATTTKEGVRSPAPTGATALVEPSTAALSRSSAKRAAEDETMEEEEAEEGTEAAKRQTCTPCDDAAADPGVWARAASGGVLLKMYDGPERNEELKVHELVEVYGLIERASEEPIGDDSMMTDTDAAGGGYMRHPMELEGEEERKQRPPPSAQPRVHVLSVRRLADASPIFLPAPDTNEEALALDAARSQLPGLREAVVSGLRASLGGDALAAEHVLLASISRVLNRHGDAPIGKFSLYLTNCPPPAAGAARSPVAAALSTALAQLLPLCASHALTIDGLNGGGIAPAKDLEANVIWPAALQLPVGSTLVVDEASLSSGQLDATGVRGLQALCSIAERQVLPYDFTYCSVDFPVDATVIGISSGGGSMLPIATKLPLRVEASLPAAEAALGGEAAPAWLDAARRYLALAVRLQHRIGGMEGAAVAKAAEEDFVQARQAEPSIGAEDLGRWLTCARLVAASALAPTVEVAHYREARRLDTERCERLRARDVTL